MDRSMARDMSSIVFLFGCSHVSVSRLDTRSDHGCLSWAAERMNNRRGTSQSDLRLPTGPPVSLIQVGWSWTFASSDPLCPCLFLVRSLLVLNLPPDKSLNHHNWLVVVKSKQGNSGRPAWRKSRNWLKHSPGTHPWNAPLKQRNTGFTKNTRESSTRAPVPQAGPSADARVQTDGTNILTDKYIT